MSKRGGSCEISFNKGGASCLISSEKGAPYVKERVDGDDHAEVSGRQLLQPHPRHLQGPLPVK